MAFELGRELARRGQGDPRRLGEGADGLPGGRGHLREQRDVPPAELGLVGDERFELGIGPSSAPEAAHHPAERGAQLRQLDIVAAIGNTHLSIIVILR